MMWRNLTAAILLGGAAPALATGDAAAGLQAMRELNLIVLGNWQAGQDVEGKAFIGGNASGNATQVGIGNANQGAAASNRRTLTIAGSNSINNLNLNNGPNGPTPQGQPQPRVATNPGVLIGGNSTNINLNAQGASLDVGGNLQGNYNVGAGQTFTIGGNLTNGGVNGSAGATIRVGGTIQGNANANGATIQQNQGIGFNAATTAAATTAELATLTSNLGALSSTLASLVIASNPSSITVQNGRATFNAVDNGAGYALFNVNASFFANSEYNYNFGTTSPVIINVFDNSQTVLNFGLTPTGGANASRNQQVIWNFVNATQINFTRMVHGSVLAMNAAISNTTPIEGSVVAKSFNQSGEVHLGTYAGTDGFLLVDPPVPEPAIWAQLITGFGLAGTALRRRRARALA